MYKFLLFLDSMGIAFSSMLVVNLSSTVYKLYTSQNIVAWLGGHILAGLPVIAFAFLTMVTVMYKKELGGK